MMVGYDVKVVLSWMKLLDKQGVNNYDSYGLSIVFYVCSPP